MPPRLTASLLRPLEGNHHDSPWWSWPQLAFSLLMLVLVEEVPSIRAANCSSNDPATEEFPEKVATAALRRVATDGTRM
ncbi:MAG: hypothetical protein QGH33_19230 [Pirellulaceae bacterium]|nr:hypothetical protein [Pirellulaceae bacterium]